MNKVPLLHAAIVLLSLIGMATPSSSQTPQALEEKKAEVAVGEVTLSSLDLSRAIQMWGSPQKDLSVAKKPLSIAAQTFANGFGTHSSSRLFVDLGGKVRRFSAAVGIDDAGGGKGCVEFKVIGDGKLLWASGLVSAGQPARPVDVALKGVHYLTLEVTDGGDGMGGDHADWVNARFEGVNGPIQVIDRLPEHNGKVVPGAPWRDTAGNLIQAHGGGILQYGGKYYWYGEDRSQGYVAIGVSAYVSEDLLNWKPLGVVLPSAAYNQKWQGRTIAERPKVVFNPRTRKFVLWFHYDGPRYSDSQAGVAVADRPEGPFSFLGTSRPVEKSTYRDMNLFVDDDGEAYAIYAGEGNLTMHIVRLNEEWTAPQQPMVEGQTWIRTFVKAYREAPAPFKYNGKYYMITSAATGWAPNAANYAVADSMLGEWKSMPNPFVGAGNEITFGSQSSFVLPVTGKPGRFIYIGDRWNPANLHDSRYIWLPFEMKPDGSFEIPWRESWKPGEVGAPTPRTAH